MLLFTEQLGERDASELMEGCDRPWPLRPLLCKESFTPTAILLYYSKKNHSLWRCGSWGQAGDFCHQELFQLKCSLSFMLALLAKEPVAMSSSSLLSLAQQPELWISPLPSSTSLCRPCLRRHWQRSPTAVHSACKCPIHLICSQFTYIIIFYCENREWSQETPKSILLTFHAGSISEDFRGTEVKLESTALFWCKRHQ